VDLEVEVEVPESKALLKLLLEFIPVPVAVKVLPS